MSPSRLLAIVPVVSSLLGLAGCPKPDDDSSDSQETDADADGDSDTDADGDSDADSDTDADPNTWGFDLRIPEERSLDCNGKTLTFTDTDWICTLVWGDVDAVVYTQNTPVFCDTSGMAAVPSFDSTAQVWEDGALGEGTDLYYDFGGGHNNDLQNLTYGGYTFTWYHSSFGYGWRACQPMDCLQVTGESDGALLEDGCTCDRTIPAVCVLVQADGTWDELVDTFEVCAGDDECGE